MDLYFNSRFQRLFFDSKHRVIPVLHHNPIFLFSSFWKIFESKSDFLDQFKKKKQNSRAIKNIMQILFIGNLRLGGMETDRIKRRLTSAWRRHRHQPAVVSSTWTSFWLLLCCVCMFFFLHFFLLVLSLVFYLNRHCGSRNARRPSEKSKTTLTLKHGANLFTVSAAISMNLNAMWKAILLFPIE